MKDKAKRAVPHRAEIAAALREARPEGVEPTNEVFWLNWPTYDILTLDLKKAGIPKRDDLGRIVHFHSFRKTWRTLGVHHGVNQRAAQEIVGALGPEFERKRLHRHSYALPRLRDGETAVDQRRTRCDSRRDRRGRGGLSGPSDRPRSSSRGRFSLQQRLNRKRALSSMFARSV